MPRPPRFPFFPHLAVIATVSLCGWLAGDSTAGPYLNSAHGNTATGVRRASLPGTYSRGNCAHCHEQHATIGGGPVAPGTVPSNFLLLDDLAGNAACNYCHNGSVLPPDGNIASQIAKASSHDPNSAKVTAPATLWCTDCHESHVAQKVNHVEASGRNLIAATSPLLEATGVSLSAGWPPAGVPLPGAEAFSIPGLNPPAPLTVIAGSMEYELCIKCHGGQTASYNVPDILVQINPNNSSAHPIDSPGWKNAFLANPANNAALANNWGNPANLNAKMYCSDCHGSETGTDPAGPHGSTQPFILKYPTPGGLYDNLCLHCHNVLVATGGVSGFVDPPGGSPHVNPQPMVGDHNLPQHLSPAMGGTNPAGCMACHGGGIANVPLVSSIHGANYQWPAFGGNPGRPSPASPSTEFLLPDQAGAYITANTYNITVPPLLGDIRGNRLCTSLCHVAGGGPTYWY